MMMKTTIFAIFLATATVGMQAIADNVQSLRGMNEINQDTVTPSTKRFVDNDEIIERSHVLEPPLIPHSIRGYRINLNQNKCMQCHSWSNHRESNATKISLTHFKDRYKSVMANVAPSRYVCTKCHVPQANVRPLVENTFKPVREMLGH